MPTDKRPCNWSIANEIVAAMKIESAKRYLKPTQLANIVLGEWLERETPTAIDPTIALIQAHDDLHEAIKNRYPLGDPKRKELLQLSRQLRENFN